MKPVHTKYVHTEKHTFYSDLRLGVGGVFWMYILLMLCNYKIYTTEKYRSVIELIVLEIRESLSIRSICAYFLVNFFRWLFIYLVRRRITSFVLQAYILTGCAAEVLLMACGIKGFTGVLVRCGSVAQFLKAISYALVIEEKKKINREAQNKKKKEESYKKNDIKKKHVPVSIVEFIAYPTLCYQEEYPRTDKISFINLSLYLLGLPPLCVLVYISLKIKVYASCRIFYLNPSLSTYLDVFFWTNFGWFVSFILGFIVLLGIQSELTRFADQNFFGSWWDTKIREYWRLWNKQVYDWNKRHAYVPLLKNHGRVASVWTIFAISGIIHECIFDTFLGVRGIGFTVMMLQAPLFYLEDFLSLFMDKSLYILSIFIFHVLGAPLVGVCSTYALTSHAK
ncbi:diacylglycerol O-acyltransferase 1 [Nematocida sp. LUAm3]|nr:diacylglycerol O-acyltransferase 1 [Nematocida sp. LUAm3]KAI5173730.1 diacylglycerol O-acyltransferase 1 [Nematocida sp. LUAm2]KAI5176953.1 diacylglycerol O-acyltransferase 1 [Nematocida sp. LUAm1]